jgi:hypothetical protein
MRARAPETLEQLAARLREEGALDERSIEYVVRSRQPGGEERVLPGETRDDAIARLMRHYDWDERTARFTLYLADGWSDLVPVDDDGTELPYFRVRDELETAEDAAEENVARP